MIPKIQATLIISLCSTAISAEQDLNISVVSSSQIAVHWSHQVEVDKGRINQVSLSRNGETLENRKTPNESPFIVTADICVEQKNFSVAISYDNSDIEDSFEGDYTPPKDYFDLDKTEKVSYCIRDSTTMMINYINGTIYDFRFAHCVSITVKQNTKTVESNLKYPPSTDKMGSETTRCVSSISGICAVKISTDSMNEDDLFDIVYHVVWPEKKKTKPPTNGFELKLSKSCPFFDNSINVAGVIIGVVIFVIISSLIIGFIIKRRMMVVAYKKRMKAAALEKKNKEALKQKVTEEEEEDDDYSVMTGDSVSMVSGNRGNISRHMEVSYNVRTNHAEFEYEDDYSLNNGERQENASIISTDPQNETTNYCGRNKQRIHVNKQNHDHNSRSSSEQSGDVGVNKKREKLGGEDDSENNSLVSGSSENCLNEEDTNLDDYD